MCNKIPCNWVRGCGTCVNHRLTAGLASAQVNNIKTHTALCQNYVVQVHWLEVTDRWYTMPVFCTYKHRINYCTVDKILSCILISTAAWCHYHHISSRTRGTYDVTMWQWCRSVTFSRKCAVIGCNKSAHLHVYMQYACIEMLQHAATALLQHFILFYFTHADSLIATYSEHMAIIG